MLRKLILGAALLAGSAAPALAGPVYGGPPPAVFDWTGFYAGLNGGYGGDRFDYPFSASETVGVTGETVTGHANLTSGGFVGGGQIGYNYQPMGAQWFVGGETDIDGSNIKGRVHASFAASGSFPLSGSVSAGSELKYLGTVRARAGYAGDRVLLYATGGLAYGEVRSFVAGQLSGAGGTILAGSAEHSDTHTGWTLGAGGEYAVTDRLTFKTEYLYVDLGEHDAINAPVSDFLGGMATGNVLLQVKTTAHVVRAGVNYKF